MAARVTRQGLEDRIIALETAVESLTARLGSIEPRVVELDGDGSRRQVEVSTLEDKVVSLEKTVQVLADRLDAFCLSFQESQALWPKVGCEDRGRHEASSKSSGAEQLQAGTEVRAEQGAEARAETCERTCTSPAKVLVLGDSLARGMGYKLRSKLGEGVEVRAVGGAKVGAVAQSVGQLPKDPARTLVVVAGANSLKDEDTVAMVEHYRGIVESGKRLSKRLVVVGLVKRYDLGPRYERKRIFVNMKLKGVCREHGVDFLEYQPERSRVYADGLHLNSWGQIELAELLKKDFLG